MSNFICPTCGLTNIDCGKEGYKTPRELELEKKLDIAVKALEEVIKENEGCMSCNSMIPAQQALKDISNVHL